MAKTKISEFSTTPGDNTDINGINIAEGCAPSGINNAIRELMSDLKEWQSGAMDVYVVPQGTAAAPGIQFYSDTNTGLYRYAADQLGIAVGGVSAGYFSSDGWVGNVVATTIDLTNIEVTNIKAKDGTAAISIADSTGKVTVSSELAVDNLNLSGNTFSSTDTNGNIVLAPNGTGDVYLDADTIRVGDANSNVTVTTNGTGDLILNTNSGTNSGAITIEDGVNGNILIATNGTGQVQLTGDLDVTTVEVTNIKAKDGTSVFTLTDSTGAVSIANAVTMAATTQNIALGTSQTSGTFTVGGAAQTGTQTFDQSTKTHTLNIGTGATESAATKTINIGTGGVATSTTAIAVGSTNGTTITLNGTVNATTVNATTLDLTNLEVTNIKAKDGTASITLADSTGVATLSANPILNAGTANGVVYLNASKSATSGSALTFDGTNLGIGTSSPSAKLDVANSGVSQIAIRNTSGTTKNTQLIYADSGGNKWQVGMDVATNNGSLTFQWYYAPTATSHLNLDSSGNLGLGVTPSAWGSGGNFELPNSASIVTQGTNAVFGANWFFDTSFKYKTTAAATYYQQTGGAHNWYSAASGTAGNTISSFPRTMGLSSGGNLTLDSGNLVVGTAGKGIDFSANTHAAGMTSELLNWYEEGTWTPVLQSWTISGTAPTVTGRYTRIGREVYLYAQIAPAGGTVSYAAAAGTSYINGLPFTPGFNSGGIWTDASNAANTLDTNLVNTTGNAYAPTIAATADVIIFVCHFSV